MKTSIYYLIHRSPEILITAVFLDEVKIPRNYPVPKCLYKQGTPNKNIIKERKYLQQSNSVRVICE